MEANDIQHAAAELLGSLIAFDADDRAVWPADDLRQMLSRQLRSRLTPDVQPGLMPDERALQELLDSADPPLDTFDDLLHHPHPPMELLRLSKDFAKLARRDAHAAVAPEICLLLYYGSIVAAMVRRNQRITRLSDDDLRNGLNWVVRQPWVDERTRSLFIEGLRWLQSSRLRWRS